MVNMGSAKLADKDQVARVITRVAAVVAILVAISLPLGYALVALEDAKDSLDFKAKVKASALNGLIATNPNRGLTSKTIAGPVFGSY